MFGFSHGGMFALEEPGRSIVISASVRSVKERSLEVASISRIEYKQSLRS